MSGAALLAPARLMLAQADLAAQGSSRANVAAIDHDRILAAAEKALGHAPRPLTSLPVPPAPATPHDFYTAVEPEGEELASARRDALLALTLDVPALAAAVQLLRVSDAKLAQRYADHAAKHLEAWFVTPGTRMTPALIFGQVLPPEKVGGQGGNPEGLIEAVGLAELAVAIPFLGLDADRVEAIAGWFGEYLEWLTTSRLAALTRDRKDRHASSWLLQAAACAKMTRNDHMLAELSHRFKTVTIRAQIDAGGIFEHELTTLNPFRNSLMNLDLLAGCCVLLTTRFDSVWEHELQDGPGMRAAVARFYAFMMDRGTWPYRADAAYFRMLPGRRPALLFAAKVYSRPEYVALWKTLDADPAVPVLLRSFPIRQPLIWVSQPVVVRSE